MIEVFEKFAFPVAVAVVAMSGIWWILLRLLLKHFKLVDTIEETMRAIVNAEQDHRRVHDDIAKEVESIKQELNECRRLLQQQKNQ